MVGLQNSKWNIKSEGLGDFKMQQMLSVGLQLHTIPFKHQTTSLTPKIAHGSTRGYQPSALVSHSCVSNRPHLGGGEVVEGWLEWESLWVSLQLVVGDLLGLQPVVVHWAELEWVWLQWVELQPQSVPRHQTESLQQ